MYVLHHARHLALGLVTVFLAAGCMTDGGRVLLIRQNQVPQEGCVISGSLGDLFRAEGTIEIASERGYFFTPVVESRAEVPEGQDAARRVITIQGAEVRLEVLDPAGNPSSFSQAPNEFTTRMSGSIEPGGTIGLGFDLLKRQHLDELAGVVGENPWLVLAEVVVFGDMAGGSVESRPFVYPVTVCDGCLIRNLGTCGGLPVGFTAQALGGECNPLQDAPVDCCEEGGALYCPAVSTATE